MALSAIRSEYDLLYPLLKGLQADSAFDVGVIAAGAHLSKLHRYSVRLIESDGFPIVERIQNFRMGEKGNTAAGRVLSGARLLSGLTAVLDRERPDLLMYLGDREEPLMAAVAANYLGIPSVHIAGGDNAHPVGGDVDEEARHATTKLSHLHLTMAKAHERRVLRLGEESWRVRTVGNPGLDRLRCEPPIGVEQLSKVVGSAAAKDYIIVIYHAVSSGLTKAPAEFALCLQQCIDTGLDVFVGAPNSDPGYADLMRITEQFSKHPRIHPYVNLPRSEFVALLKGAKAIVGNSSLGLLEASFIGVPCVNVGQRQRERLAGINVQFIDAEAVDLRQALQKSLFDHHYRAKVKRAKSPYGDGFMVERAIEFLKSLPPRESLLDKRITY